MANNAMMVHRSGPERDALVHGLSELGWMVTSVDSAGAAFDALRWTQVSLLVVELELAQDHLELLFEPLGPETRKIVLAGAGSSAESVDRVRKLGADEVLAGQVSAHDLARPHL